MTISPDSSPPGEFYCPHCEQAFPIGDRCPDDGTRLVRLSARIDPFLGRELDGRYTILEKLGQGGMGAVYRGSQHSVGREVAIKVVSSHLVSEPDVIKRFLREAKLASRLSHPNAVAVLDFGQTDDGVFYLVMELVTGRTLDEVIKEEHVFRPERLVRIGMQICDALEGAHELQIVHRDLKPANVMLLTSGRDLVKVLDFGLAKSVAPDQAVTTMTNAGALLGTPAFMPPELALGQPCDGRADLYSLGCVLYLLGSGKLPFAASSAHELVAAHGTEQAPPMTGVPAPLAAVIDRLLQKDPEHRYHSAADARDALEQALDPRAAYESSPSLAQSRPLPAMPAAFAHTHGAVQPPRPRRRVWPALALVCAAAIGVGAYVALAGADAPAPVRAVAPSPAPAPVPMPAATPAAESPAPAPPPPAGSADTITAPHPAHRVVKHPPPVHKPQVEKTVAPPQPTPPPPPTDGAGSGSAKKPGLPF